MELCKFEASLSTEREFQDSQDYTEKPCLGEKKDEKTQVPFAASTGQLTTTCNSSPRRPDAFSGFHQHQVHPGCTNIQGAGKTLTEIKKTTVRWDYQDDSLGKGPGARVDKLSSIPGGRREPIPLTCSLTSRMHGIARPYPIKKANKCLKQKR